MWLNNITDWTIVNPDKLLQAMDDTELNARQFIVRPTLGTRMAEDRQINIHIRHNARDQRMPFNIMQPLSECSVVSICRLTLFLFHYSDYEWTSFFTPPPTISRNSTLFACTDVYCLNN